MIILGIALVLGIIIYVINHDFGTSVKVQPKKKLIFDGNVLFESPSIVYTSDGNNIYFGNLTGLYKYSDEITKITSDPIIGLARNDQNEILVLKSTGKLYAYSGGEFVFQSSGVTMIYDTIDGFYINCDSGEAYIGNSRAKNSGTYGSIIFTLS